MSDSRLTVKWEILDRSGVTVITLSGRLDVLCVGEIRQQLLGLPDNGQNTLVIDLSALDWIDSSGVGALITLYKRARIKGGDVKVAGLQRQPKEIFRLLRLESAFEVFETTERAVASFSGATPAV